MDTATGTPRVTGTSVAARRFRRLITCLLLASTAACYHYRAVPYEPVGEGRVGGAPPPATEYEGETAWALFWGFVQERPEIENCRAQALAEVTVTSNFAYSLLTIVTLGFAAPVHVRWRCAKATPVPDTLGLADPPSAAPGPAFGSGPSGGRVDAP